MALQLNVRSFQGDELFRFAQTQPLPGLPDFFNLQFQSNNQLPPNELAGPGVYLVSYQGQPIYLGKYLGKKSAPFKGNVLKLRWLKHIATLTLRGSRLSLSRKSLQQLASTPDITFIEQLQAAEKEFLHTDRGCVSTASRALFANKYWPDFNNISAATLADFSFTYLKIDSSHGDLSTDTLRAHISTIENALIRQYPLFCNTTSASVSDEQSIPDLNKLTDICYEALARFSHSVNDALAKPEESSDEIEPENRNPDTQNLTENDDTGALSSNFQAELDAVDDWANDFITQLVDHIENQDRLETYHTKNESMRIRVHFDETTGTNAMHQVFATLNWQPKNKAFFVRLDASVYDFRHFNLTINKSDPLPAEFRISEQDYRKNGDALIQLITRSATLVSLRHTK